MKHKPASVFVSMFLLVCLGGTPDSSAQTVRYRQTILSSNLPNVANNITQDLVSPWGIAFHPRQAFFIANNKTEIVTSHDDAGASLGLAHFRIPNVDGTGIDNPTGMVVDENSFFGGPVLDKPFIVVSDGGAVFTWGPNLQGIFPREAILVKDNSNRGAVYKGVAILNSALTAPVLAVTDFRGGFVETFLPGFDPVALPGSFTDPNLPAGYAPFGIQVIGRQVFVTYAFQDLAKHDPIPGAGNGIVNLFDLDGNFVQRFATGGALNAPWGIVQATANFGPLSNDILIGNVGDGTINAFDPATGDFLGELTDGDGNDLVEPGLHALAFRDDGFGEPDTLYFTSDFSSEENGLFGAITTGLVSMTRVDAPNASANTPVTITATVTPEFNNPGSPTGSVTFRDGSNLLGTSALLNGVATIDTILTDVRTHNITALYGGDHVFLPSSDNAPVEVTGTATTTTLTAPATASPTSAVTLRAVTRIPGGFAVGNVQFLDTVAGISHVLGESPLDATGTSTLTVSLIGVAEHSVIAHYEGNGSLAASDSAAMTINVSDSDFSIFSDPTSATVKAGQSAQFMLAVASIGGFSEDVTFSCSQVPGITCTFNPARVGPASGSNSTLLTVGTSVSAPAYALLTSGTISPPGSSLVLVFVLVLSSFVLRCGWAILSIRSSPPIATVSFLVVALSVTLVGCGGYGNNTQSNRGTSSIVVTAQSGAISHVTTVRVTVQ